MPIQQMMLGSGGASNTFLDEIFKTALWYGDGASTHNIDNGMDLASTGAVSYTHLTLPTKA